MFLLLASLLPALGQDVTSVFIPPTQPLTAGTSASLWLFCMNNSSQPVSHAFESSLAARFISGISTNDTVLTLKSDQRTEKIAPGAFVKAEYQLDIPAAIQGQATLVVSNYNPLIIPVAGTVAIASAAGQSSSQNAPPQELPSGASPTTSPPDTTAASALANYTENHLLPYEPVYFLLGTYPAAEFQVSLKYRLFSYSDNWNPVNNFYFGYTQTSYWDLLTRDPSFYDTSYKPSAFFYYTNVLRGVLPAKFPVHLDLQGGVEHESNGRGGTEERSLYTAYFQPTVTYNVTTNLSFMLQPRVWYYFILGDNNRNLAEYRGYADVRTAIIWQNWAGAQPWQKIQLSSRVRLGDEGSHPGVTADFRFNLPHWMGFDPAIQVEYFYGYGQTLRQYNQLSHGVRAGLCLWY